MQSVVSYPERGKGGRNTYRGNCSPKLIVDLHDQYGFKSISDYMCGSGTTEDAAREMGVESHCYDLNRGFDLLSMDIAERNEFIFWHPPYGDMITYAGEQYSAEEVKAKYGFDPIPCDLSHIKDWDKFVEAMNYCMMKQYASLEKGGRIAVLMGDMKRKGKLYSMLVDIVKPGTLEQIVIKMQHNCVSDGRSYSGRFIPIVHEYVMICRKDGWFRIPVTMSVRRDVDVSDISSPTWKDVVLETLRDMAEPDEPVGLDRLYERIGKSKRAKRNPHWREKVRQTLQTYPQYFKHEARGVWALAG